MSESDFRKYSKMNNVKNPSKRSQFVLVRGVSTADEEAKAWK